jgi:hypothetical protein
MLIKSLKHVLIMYVNSSLPASLQQTPMQNTQDIEIQERQLEIRRREAEIRAQELANMRQQLEIEQLEIEMAERRRRLQSDME